MHLYPKLSIGDILIVDDYGHWDGARRVVDEYIGDNRFCSNASTTQEGSR